MRRRTLMAALPFAGSALARAASAATEKMPLRVCVGPHAAMAPFFTGYEAGYFAEAGFEIDLERQPGSVRAIPLIAGGNLDVCFLSDHAALLNAVARGARIRIVAGRQVTLPGCNSIGAVYVRRQSFPHGIASLRPLKGSKVALIGDLGGIVHYGLEMLLAHDGMRPEDVQVQRMGRAESIAAFASGGVAALIADGTDAGVLPPSLELEQGPVWAQLQPGFEFSWIVFGGRLLDGNVEVGARFLRAYLRGNSEFLNGRTPAFLDELARSQNLDAGKTRAACRDGFVRDGRVSVEDLRRFIQWAAGKGLCPGSLDAAALIDTRFLEAVTRGSHRG